MIDQASQTTCKDCGKPLEQTERQGPHKREFCNGTCRKRWHRKQKEQSIKSLATMDTIDAQARIAQLEQELAAANDMIDKLLSRKKTTTPLKRSYQERLTRKGEALDWPALEIRTTIKPGRKNWRVFMLNESNDQLIRAIIAVERLEEKRS